MHTFLILVLITLVFEGCKKYEGDERRYFRSACGRVAKKWKLYKITNRQGKEFQDSVIFFKTADNQWAIRPEQSFTYNGMELEFERSGNLLCIETGIRGKAFILNKPFGSGKYELAHKRKFIKLELTPHRNTPRFYFNGSYRIHKMNSDELIFGNGFINAYFRVF